MSSTSPTTPLAWPDFPAQEDPVETLIKLSRYYGSDPAFVLAGGGNTSVKIGDRLYVKASGTALATIKRSGFVILDRQQLAQIAEADFGTEVESREAQYKTAIMNARLELPDGGGTGPRPSVESLLHHLVPRRFVVHTHATVINALTCSIHGAQLAREWFGDTCLWVEFVDPGYTLGRVLKENLAYYQTRHQAGGKNAAPSPKVILMANHGMIVAGDTPAEVRTHTADIVACVTAKLGGGEEWQTAAWGTSPRARRPNTGELQHALESALRSHLAEPLAEAAPPVMVFDDSPLVSAFVNSESGPKTAALGPLNPDQIVYCTSFPLWFVPRAGEASEAIITRLRTQLAAHKHQYKYDPRIVLVQGLGLFAIGENYQTALTALQLYCDTIQVMSGALQLGGVQPLSAAKRAFIENWEVEAYRRQIARKAL